MIPLEPFKYLHAVIGTHILLANTTHMAKPNISDMGKYTLPTIVGVIVKSQGKRSSYIIFILSGHEELRLTIYSTMVHSFIYFLHPSYVHNIVFSRSNTWA